MSKWDLTPLFESKAALLENLKQQKQHCQSFEQSYSNQLANLSLEAFEEAMRAYEQCCENLSRVMTYAFLRFASDAKEGAFLAECELKVNNAQEHLLFFELEFNTLEPQKQQEFIEGSQAYGYYLELLSKGAKYQLSLPEEKVLLKTQPVGVDAFKRLFDEHFSAMRFSYDGQEMSEEEILSLLYAKEQETRKQAANTLTNELKKHLPLLTYIFNQVRKDLKITAELRGYESLEQSRHLSNQTTQKSVDCMVECINSHYAFVEQYYALKAKILGFDRLYDYDRYAPLPFEEQDQFSYEDSKALVLESLRDFSLTFYNIAHMAFRDGWIDAMPREHKRSGAFSHGAVPSVHPYLMLNHTNRRRDVFTMAHELGHTIHQKLSYKVGHLNADTPLTTAETASVFAEMLLFDKMKQNLSQTQKIALYAGKIEDIFATLFRQNVFTNFERRLHAKEGEMTADELSTIWQEENQKMFGQSVLLREEYKIWWSYIPHFIHSPFYCYAYSYGQLLVMALFGIYRQDREAFIPTYEHFLSLGGSKSPKEMVALFGMDIEDEHFWQIGMQEVKRLLDEFRAIVQND